MLGKVRLREELNLHLSYANAQSFTLPYKKGYSLIKTDPSSDKTACRGPTSPEETVCSLAGKKFPQRV